MITVDCRDIESIKQELLVYVADNVGAIPALKLHEFVLSPIDDEPILHTEVVDAIKEFLDSLGEIRNFAVIAQGDVIVVKSTTGKVIEREVQPVPKNVEGMFLCTHCGYVTRYETEYLNHVKIHYI